jgi:carbonic anhydrase
MILVQLTADFKHLPQLQHGSFGAKYDLHQVHFHWGGNDFEGSEHRINGRQYPLEVHVQLCHCESGFEIFSS